MRQLTWSINKNLQFKKPWYVIKKGHEAHWDDVVSGRPSGGKLIHKYFILHKLYSLFINIGSENTTFPTHIYIMSLPNNIKGSVMFILHKALINLILTINKFTTPFPSWKIKLHCKMEKVWSYQFEIVLGSSYIQ